LFSLIVYENLLGDAIKFGEMRKKRLDVKFGPFTQIGRDAIKFGEMRKKRLDVKFGPFTQIERCSLRL
jgi:hypothetical protein